MTGARFVAVFGGSGALGRAVVGRLVTDGWKVNVCDAHVPEIASRIDGASYLEVDALDEDSVASALVSEGSGLWAVVNLIGGYTPGQRLVDLDLAVLRKQFELNVVTAATITKHAVAALLRSGGGRIVHTSSRVAVQDGSGGFAYSVSKLGVVRLVEAAAAESRDAGITVNCVMPSIIDTPANREAMPGSDHSRWPKPEQIAGVVAFLVSEESELVSGAAVPVYGRA